MTRKPVAVTEGHIEFYRRQVVNNGPRECWGWRGALNRSGYGVVSAWDRTAHRRHRNSVAHRVSFFIAHGALPAGRDIMHLCHNPACSNPAHLRAGSRAENMQTSQIVGRMQRRIPLADLPAICLRRAMGETLEAIAQSYGCTKQAVRHMIKAHGAGMPRAPDYVCRGKIHRDEKPKIIARKRQGETLAQIAADYGVNFQTISKIVNGHR